jgi:hypothetical protein
MHVVDDKPRLPRIMVTTGDIWLVEASRQAGVTLNVSWEPQGIIQGRVETGSNLGETKPRRSKNPKWQRISLSAEAAVERPPKDLSAPSHRPKAPQR